MRSTASGRSGVGKDVAAYDDLKRARGCAGR